MSLWQATQTGTQEELAARVRRIYEGAILQDIDARPVHHEVRAALDPEQAVATFDLSNAETRGEPVEVDDYPPGTWFYYTPSNIYVRRAGADHIERVEGR